LAGELILVVEDNDKNLKLVRDVLQLKGYQVLEAQTAEQGLALAAERSPDLVLMDIQLPGMDGVTALGQLRSSTSMATPVVALTAFAMKEDRERFLAAGFDGYLPKPIDIRALADQVRTFIERGRQTSDNRLGRRAS
jgi:CheY-like chemotaxis protein